MRRFWIAVALGGVWLLCVLATSGVTASSQSQLRAQLFERFQARADTGSGFVAAYVADVFTNESRLARRLTSGSPDDAGMVRTLALMGSSAGVLLDRSGRIVAVAPAAPALRGEDLASRHAHLSSAIEGRRAVSDVVPSAVRKQPVVAFALPLSDRRFGALSVAFDLERSPLRAFLARQPVPGTRAYLVDGNGAAIVAAGPGASADRVPRAEPGGGQRRGERYVAAASIPGTRWTYVLDAPVSSIQAPGSASLRTQWRLLAAFAAVLLLGLGLLGATLASRTRAREEKAESDERFRLTVEHAPIGMSVLRPDLRFVEPNVRLCRMLGYSAQELQGMTLGEVTHPEDLELDARQVEELVRGAIESYELEKRYLRSDGSVVWGRLTVSAVRDHRGRPLYFVSQVEDVTDIRAAQEDLEHRALYDPLTGLANRSLFVDRLTQALSVARDTAEVAVGFCDLDHFKQVNDVHGHHVGDAVLQVVADRLRSCVRATDTVARMGGDEFIILFSGSGSHAEARRILDRARRAVEAPLEVPGLRAGEVCTVGLSGGLALAGPGDTAETLLRDSDAALYAAKHAGRGRCEVYNAAFRSRTTARRTLERDLQRAIHLDELELHYQPVVDLVDRRPVAYEALVRWRHPQRGLLMPAEFIDLAEESDRILDLGALVLRHACRFLAQHKDESWRVFVNTSPRQLGRGLPSVVRRELAAVGVPPTRLGLEITENGVLGASGSSLAEMAQLRDLGLDILIDDFGTGYSALSSVMDAPVTGLKLDRSFTARLGDDGPADRITSTVATLVQSLSLHGVAEGIETPEQAEVLVRLGWRFGQGYLFARPLPAALLHRSADLSGVGG